MTLLAPQVSLNSVARFEDLLYELLELQVLHHLSALCADLHYRLKSLASKRNTKKLRR